jgi:N-methylhydantoinase A
MQIAVDIGGTFTDVVGARGGEIWTLKVPSVPGDLSAGVVTGVREILRISGAGPGDVERFIHGTTVATNAVLERKGARVGLLMTEGFEDVIELGRQKRSSMYDLMMAPETPTFLAPGRRRRGIPERIDADGGITLALDEEAVRKAVGALVASEEIEAVAICYLFSFLNPDHEARSRDIIGAAFPGLDVSISCEVDPVFREYERTCVTAFDAYVRPVVARYVQRLQAALAELGITARMLIMQSRGGIASADRATERPVTTLLSGPAAGALGGKAAGESGGFADLITFDMGGTSSDVAMARSGTLSVSNEGRIIGYPLRLPMVDMNTIGAGGGSIAWIDDAGVLKVGPGSAGADPGPACYQRGGVEATVTDASVVLGYIDPGSFAGGLSLDAAAAEQAVQAVAERIGLTLAETAIGIHTVCNAAMADAVRMLTVKRGFDARDHALVMLGGAGPVHGGMIAELLRIRTLIVPPRPGVLAAEGLFHAPIECDLHRTFLVPAARADPGAMRKVLDGLEKTARRRLAADGVDDGLVGARRSADMRYLGQSYELEVDLPDKLDSDGVEIAVQAFQDRYRQVLGHGSLEEAVEFVNLRVVAGVSATPPASVTRDDGIGREAAPIIRLAYFGRTRGWLETPTLRRETVTAGEAIVGPAIINQPDTTTVVYPGHQCRLDRAGNLVIKVPKVAGHGL